MSQIDINKTYRTRNGMEVVLYAIHDEQDCPVHGAYREEGEWCSDAWRLDGRNSRDFTEWDLVEVKPRINGEVWLNIYPWGCGSSTYKTREAAEINAQRELIACIKIEYDVEEGEGL